MRFDDWCRSGGGHFSLFCHHRSPTSCGRCRCYCLRGFLGHHFLIFVCSWCLCGYRWRILLLIIGWCLGGWRLCLLSRSLGSEVTLCLLILFFQHWILWLRRQLFHNIWHFFNSISSINLLRKSRLCQKGEVAFWVSKITTLIFFRITFFIDFFSDLLTNNFINFIFIINLNQLYFFLCEKNDYINTIFYIVYTCCIIT